MSTHELRILTVSAESPLNSLTLQSLYALNDADLIVHDQDLAKELRDLWSLDLQTHAIAPGMQHNIKTIENDVAGIASLLKRGQRVTRIALDLPSSLSRLHLEVKALQRQGVKYKLITSRDAFEKEAWQLKLPWLVNDQWDRFRIIESSNIKGDLNFWKNLASGSETLAIDSSLGSLKRFVEQLLEAGADPLRPVALVAHSPLQDPICWLTTLDEVDELLPQWKTKGATILYVGAWPRASSKGNQQDFWGPLAADAFQWLRTGTVTGVG
jgi:siroheme synthase